MKMNRKAIFFLFFSLIVVELSAQNGGTSTYQFLSTPVSARQVSMGGNLFSKYDNDIQLSIYNPALLTSEIDNQLMLNFTDHFSDIKQGSFAYAKNIKKVGNFQTGIQYIDYGSFKETDASGNELGEFTANDLVFTLGWGRRLDSTLSIGSNLKFINSSYQDYHSTAIAADVAATYINTKKRLSLTLIARNMGTQIKSYNNVKEDLPFEMLLGFSQKLKNAPFTYSLIWQNLEKWDLTYTDPNDPTNERDAITNEIKQKSKTEKFTDKTLRHLIFGLEFQPFKAFAFRISYNYKHRKEVSVPSDPGMSGFAWGFGIRVSKFQISYARDIYHPAGAPNYFTIATNLNSFFKK
jgi:hypothetical protein